MVDMPERLFKYIETPDLISGVKELSKLLASANGPINAQKNSQTGFLIQTGAISQTEIKNRFMNARYEIYLRGQGVDGKDADELCADYEPTSPYLEKRMKMAANFQKWPGGFWWGGSIVGW